MCLCCVARYREDSIMLGDSVLQDDVSCMPFSSAGLLVLLLLLTGLRNTVCELVCDQRWVYFGFEGLRELASNTGSVNDWTAVPHLLPCERRNKKAE